MIGHSRQAIADDKFNTLRSNEPQRLSNGAVGDEAHTGKAMRAWPWLALLALAAWLLLRAKRRVGADNEALGAQGRCTSLRPDETIFVSLWGESDVALARTVRALYSRAFCAARVRLAVAYRARGDGVKMSELRAALRDIHPHDGAASRRIVAATHEAEGRARLHASFFRGEQYCLQLRAGANCDQDWDRLAVSAASRCGGVLTGRHSVHHVHFACFSHWARRGAARCIWQPCAQRAPSRPSRSLFWTADFSFCASRALAPWEPALDVCTADLDWLQGLHYAAYLPPNRPIVFYETSSRAAEWAPAPPAEAQSAAMLMRADGFQNWADVHWTTGVVGIAARLGVAPDPRPDELIARFGSLAAHHAARTQLEQNTDAPAAPPADYLASYASSLHPSSA